MQNTYTLFYSISWGYGHRCLHYTLISWVPVPCFFHEAIWEGLYFFNSLTLRKKVLTNKKCFTVSDLLTMNIVAAFRGMHVSPAKHNYVWLPRKCDYRTDRHTHTQTDAGQSDPYVPLCFAGDTKKETSHLADHIRHPLKLHWGQWPLKDLSLLLQN